MVYHVYKIENLLNGKIYVGKTNDLVTRWRYHTSSLLKQTPKNSTVIRCAIQKYGKENFDFSILETCQTDEESLKKEIHWIEFYRCNVRKFGNDSGYNMNEGGAGTPHSEITCKKISTAKKGIKFSDEHKQKLSLAHIGKILKEDHKKKIRVAGLGKKRTLDSIEKISKAKLGEKNPQAKLSEENVREIKTLLQSNQITPKNIGIKFGVASRTIRDIKNGITWQHVE
jgi:group I intron endonuclease